MKALFSLFTVVPVNSSMTDFEDLSRRFWLLPIIGAFFGIIASLALFVSSEVFSLFLSAVLVVFILQALNRFLHFDGLMDLGDGLIAHGDQGKKLGAMKDSSIGAGGVAFALFFTLLSIAALASLPSHHPAQILIIAPFVAEVLSRNAMLVCTSVGKPRPGLGSTFVSNTSRRAIIPSFVLSWALSAVTWYLLVAGSEGAFDLLNSTLISLPPYIWITLLSFVIALVSVLVGLVMARIALRSFGCVNGDVIGATNEITRPVVLMTITLLVMIL
ncbi:MAG: adenosylcobinamide-GDP ribazoletransferase [Methanomassiliicoccales archaeon]|nr:adenosylcobinamide-GDP ribazoletransferase [Methanomassiliicoccales archaeon]NYT14576.1 adenosylcobinamide-GDP ribazoletransferase [Methanomassiliicoccales archaeon]